MTPIEEIRARLEAATKGSANYDEWLEGAPTDIRTLLDERDRLREALKAADAVASKLESQISRDSDLPKAYKMILNEYHKARAASEENANA